MLLIYYIPFINSIRRYDRENHKKQHKTAIIYKYSYHIRNKKSQKWVTEKYRVKDTTYVGVSKELIGSRFLFLYRMLCHGGHFQLVVGFGVLPFFMLKIKLISNTIHVHAYKNFKIDIDHEKSVYMFHKDLLYENMSQMKF